MNTQRKSLKPRTAFAVQVAQLAVEEALRLTAKNANQRFVAMLVPPRAADAEVYEEAAQLYLRTFLSSLVGDTQPCIVEVETKAPSTRLQTYASFDHIILIVPNPEAITADARLLADRVVTLRLPNAEDFRAAARTIYETSLPRESADFLLEMPLATLALAFPKGRPYSTAMRKARSHFRSMEALRTVASAGVRSCRETRTLDHLPGYGGAKTWGLRLAADLAEWKAGRIDWSEVDQGIVLMGPAGVGKTIFARALANTCEVTFLHASPARWQSYGHLGDALKAMRASFSEARSKAPVILFLDELDSIPDRDSNHGDNANYVQQFVNAFLECLDGSERRDGVVVVGATNRVQDIDPAVMRPGRLERVIHIPLPSAADRYEILRLNLPPLPPGRSEHFDLVTEGWTGADVEQLARDLSRVSRLSGQKITLPMVESLLPDLHPLEPEVLFRIAVHEAGHAICAKMIEHSDVQSISVNRFASTKPSGSHGSVVARGQVVTARTKELYERRIATAMGGIAAECLVFGDHSDGGGGTENSDLAVASHLATCMVAVFGMDDTWLSLPTTDIKQLETLRSRDPDVRKRVEAILGRAFQRAYACLRPREKNLRHLAWQAMTEGNLGREEIDRIVSSDLSRSVRTPSMLEDSE